MCSKPTFASLAAMTQAEQCLAAIDETRRFLGGQRKLSCYEQIVAQQTQSLLRRFEGMRPISAEDGARLSDALKGGWLPRDAEGPLHMAISNKINVLGEASSRANASRPKQTCWNWASYLTGNDIKILESRISNYSKLDQVATRMVRVGLTLPTETCYGHILKLLGLELPIFLFAKCSCCHDGEPGLALLVRLN